MTTTVKAAGAAEFLSLVPHLLGFRPTQSLVIIPFAGSRSLGAMRFDLPPTGKTSASSLAASAVGMVCRLRNADALAAVVYTGARFGGERMPRRALLREIQRRAHASGLGLTDALCVAVDGWGSHLDPDCPDAGRPLAELDGAAGLVPGLRSPEGDQASGACLPEVTAAEQSTVAEAIIALGRAVDAVCTSDPLGAPTVVAERRGATKRRRAARDASDRTASRRPRSGANGEAAASAPPPPTDGRIDPRAFTAVCLLDDLPSFFEDAATAAADELDAFEIAALAWCLHRPALRDIALVQWSAGLSAGDEALEAQLRWEAGEEYPAHLAMHMWGEAPQPDPERLVRALAVTRRVAALAPEPMRPGALAMCAWLSWALGRSTHADLYAREACAIEPEHGLSEIVRSFVLAGHLPDWAFRGGSGGAL